MLKKLLFALFIGNSAFLIAEKKPLDHTVYDSWQSIGENQISDNGSHVLYMIKPQEGDSRLVIRELSSDRSIEIDRGYNGMFTKDNRYAICQIKPFFSDLRQAKIKKKKADDMPKDSLAIINLSDGTIEKIANTSSWKTGTSATPLLAFLAKPTAPAVADSVKSKQKKNKADKDKSLLIRNLLSNTTDTLHKVTSYLVSYDGSFIAAIAKGDSLSKNEVYTYSVKNPEFKKITSGNSYYGQLSFGKEHNKLAFLTSADTSVLVSKRCMLMMWDQKMPQAVAVIDTSSLGMPAGWGVSEHAQPRFSKDGTRIFFGTSPVRVLKDTTLVDFETARLDIWHYADPLIPPMQLKRKDRELKRSFLSVAEAKANGNMIQLADEKMKNILLPDNQDTDFVLGEDSSPYDIEMQWLGSSTPKDIYVVNTRTGERTLIEKAVNGSPLISPFGKYIHWFDTEKRNYFVYDIAARSVHNLTASIADINFFDEEDDTPAPAREYGFAGWLKYDDAFIVYDNFDLWQLDPKNKKKPVCLTAGEGRKNNTVLRMVRLDKEKRFIDPKDDLLLQALNKTSKKRGFYSVRIGKNKPQQLIIDGFSYGQIVRALNKNVFIYLKGNFTNTYNLFTTSDFWKTEKRLSDINPQMSEYLWGEPELYQWTTFSGKPAEGIVYKPENFNPAKKYPVLIYFYERVTDNMYNYVSPSPSRSIINIPFYTSRGYVVFTPDIRYTDGEPGESAYDYIVSGAQSLTKYPWVNASKMGIQGQSWGGYQVSYLITRTDMFAAAGAGAPVSNMTSAYGGIRWSTGMSRQFQYERTQSRIGKTLWEGFDLYVKNSPVFFADKVTTPVLIMHNDNDGAVPWYQGIEFFMGLRRLNKKAWMLQYNNEEHNLNERRNMKDLTIRWQQFFDHYLKEEPMPAWMKYGVPATRKGLYFGFELEED